MSGGAANTIGNRPSIKDALTLNQAALAKFQALTGSRDMPGVVSQFSNTVPKLSTKEQLALSAISMGGPAGGAAALKVGAVAINAGPDLRAAGNNIKRFGKWLIGGGNAGGGGQLATAGAGGPTERTAALPGKVGHGSGWLDGLKSRVNQMAKRKSGSIPTRPSANGPQDRDSTTGQAQTQEPQNGTPGPTPGRPNLRFEDSPKHHQNSTGGAARPPTAPQPALDRSIPIKPTTTRRVSVDPQTGEFSVFDEAHEGTGIYHGHVRTWNELSDDMKIALQRAGVVDKKGRVKR